MVVVLAAISILIVDRTRTSTAFAAGNATSVPAAVGEAHSFGIGASTRDVDIESVTVRFAEGSARAATELSICHQAGASQIGHATGGELAAWCDPLSAAIGMRLHESEFAIGAEYLVLTVVPLEIGTVLIEHVEVRYRSGRHVRTDPVGPRIEMSTVERLQ